MEGIWYLVPMFSSVGGVRSPLSTEPRKQSAFHGRNTSEGRELREQLEEAGSGRRGSREGGCEGATIENMWEAVKLRCVSSCEQPDG
jgi:hypothetical protein